MKISIFCLILTVSTASTKLNSQLTTVLGKKMSVPDFKILESSQPSSKPVSLLQNLQELQRVKRYYENAIFISTVLSNIATGTWLARTRTIPKFANLSSAYQLSTLQRLSLTKNGRTEAKKIIKAFDKRSNSSRLRRYNQFHAREKISFDF